MRLPSERLDLATQLAEFDVWITPTMGEVRDTERFRTELDRVCLVVELLGAATNEFADLGHCDPTAIAEVVLRAIEGKSRDEAFFTLDALASVLYLVTGKSDNNVKCQFPLHLRDAAKWDGFPKIVRRDGERAVIQGPSPRELKARDYMRLVGDLASQPDHQKRLLREFIAFVLRGEHCITQLWSVGRSYFMLKPFARERDLLAPLVVFQVRGSVSASGGHDPEEILRRRMQEWGLRPEIDFNSCDVVVGQAPQGGRKKTGKTRAYDFVLPYRAPGWEWCLFVQCQFYAGDSGSVFHKNVDQTSESRRYVARRHAGARFVEFVDGAGYFSSLNGDLRNRLAMRATKSFFQVRSCAVRLRRELQEIGFLCPIELEQAVLRSRGRSRAARRILEEERYTVEEIDRVARERLELGQMRDENGTLTINEERRTIARRYLLLDVAACFGKRPDPEEARLTGCLPVPGYGPFHGMKIDELAAKTLDFAPALQDDWSKPTAILEDIRWLCEQGLAMSS